MRGDVHVVERLEREDRRKNRAARKLIKKLYGRGRSEHAVVRSPQFSSSAFASDTTLICHQDTIQAQRRLFKARDADDKRAFFVGEVSREFDEPTCLVVAPRTAHATPQLAGCVVTKDTGARSKTSSVTVCVLEQSGRVGLSLANKTGDAVNVRKLHIQNGLTVFYADVMAHNAVTLSPPYTLGLDRKTFTDIQRLIARLAGFEFKPR